jgi:hypothetical protein
MSDTDAIDIEPYLARLTAAGHRVTLGGFTDTDGAAALLGCAPKTLRNWRTQKRGPRAFHLPGGVFYDIAQVISWCNAQSDAP